MNAIHAGDHIVLPVSVKQNAAIDAETIGCGADFHGKVLPAGNALALDIQGCFAGVRFKEFCQVFDVEHWRSLYPLPAG